MKNYISIFLVIVGGMVAILFVTLSWSQETHTIKDSQHIISTNTTNQLPYRLACLDGYLYIQEIVEGRVNRLSLPQLSFNNQPIFLSCQVMKNKGKQFFVILEDIHTKVVNKPKGN